MAALTTLLDAPDQILEAHDRLRAGRFALITIINARTALDARAWLGQWARVHRRIVVTAPDLDPKAALAAYRMRLPAHSLPAHSLPAHMGDIAGACGPLLRLPGQVREALPVAEELARAHAGLGVVLTCGIGEMVDSLLDRSVPEPLVGMALQGLVPVDAAERHVIQSISAARKVPFLRGPCEGILFHMLEARDETRGRFAPNARVPGRTKRSHELDLFCEAARLVIEIDGREHEIPRRKRMDEDKQRDLEAAGYRVERFTNHAVIHDPVAVWRDIADMISRRTMRTGA